MKPEPSRAEALFLAAAEIAVPEERAAFLDRECDDDNALRERVEALLASHHEAGDFLSSPAHFKPIREVLPDEPKAQGELEIRRTVAWAKTDESMQTATSSPEMAAEFARLKPEEGGERIGHYKLLQKIGEGGFGTVWMAEQAEPVRRRVALKIIKLGMDTKEVIARFEQERQALAMMDHPNIAKVLDAGATPTGRPFFVMELVRGIRITDYCDQHNLPTADRLQLFIAVCHAVQHAHQKGIIHRDLKPSNIMVTLHDGVPVPKVIDFGVAKAMQQQRLTDLTLFTQFEQMIGTPLYMSPEQAEMSGLDIDTRSDIYSLGVLLYELLVGRTPVDAETLRRAGLDEIRRIIREEEPPRPSMALQTMAATTRSVVADHRHVEPPRLIGLLRGDLDWIVMKALEKDRTRRYETATALGLDIQRHLGNEPVLARPPGRAYRARKFVRRHRGAVGAAIALLAVLTIGLVSSTLLFWRERNALIAAKAARVEAEQSRKTAERSERQAKIEAAKSAQSSRFIADMLSRIDPAHASGRDTTLLAEMLTQAAERVGAEFAEQPEVEADIRVTIGRAYHALGDPNTASQHFERVLKLREGVLGPENLETLDALQALAEERYIAGDLAGADVLSTRAVERSRRILGADAPLAFRTLGFHATVRNARGDHAEAVALYRTVIETSTRVHGPDHPETLETMDRLAQVFLIQHEDAQAEALFRKIIPARARVLGPDDLATLSAMQDLSVTLESEEQYGEAEALNRDVLARRRRVLGADHPDTLASLHSLAEVLQDQEKWAAAEAVILEAIERRERVLGPGHKDSLRSRQMLAVILKGEGRHDEAQTGFLEVLASRKRHLGAEHPDTLKSMDGLAREYERSGKLSEAEALEREVLEVRRRVLQALHPETLRTAGILSHLLVAQRKFDEAEPFLLASYEDAKQLFERNRPTGTPPLTQALNNLIALYDAWLKPEQAANWRRQLGTILK